MHVFVLPRGVQEFQAVAIADLKGHRGPKTGCGVGRDGDMVDQHWKECVIPSIPITVVHDPVVYSALGLGGRAELCPLAMSAIGGRKELASARFMTGVM